MSVVRCILNCDDENLILATRAVQFLLKEKPERRDAYLAYGDKVEMYARRRKASIVVRQVKP